MEFFRRMFGGKSKPSASTAQPARPSATSFVPPEPPMAATSGDEYPYYRQGQDAPPIPVHTAATSANGFPYYGQARGATSTPVQPAAASEESVSPGQRPYDAACSGNVELVRDFLKAGLDPNIENKIGWIALVGAVWEAKHEVAKLLLEFGANVEDIAGGNTALHHVVSADLRRINLEYASGGQQRQRSPAEAVLKTVEVLVAHGAKVNVGDDSTTVLSMAAIWCAESVVGSLLEAGADPNFSRGHSPLEWARKEKRDDITNLLLRHAASDPEATSKKTATAPVTETNFSDREESMKKVLAQVGARLLTERDPTLPVVRLRLQETGLGKQIGE